MYGVRRLYLWLFVGVVALSLADSLSAAVVYDQEVQWNTRIKSRVVLNLSGNTLSWTITHVSTYNTVGAFDIFKNGAVFQSYVGTSVGQPYNQTQTGSMPVAPGDTFAALFATWTFPQGQTVTISPTSVNPLRPGENVTFTASGGSNAYAWTSTGGTLTGTGNTRSFTVTTEGDFTVSVYAVAGNGLPQSNTATATVHVVKSITLRIPLKNDYKFPVSYLAFKNGAYVNSADVPPGGTDTLQVTDVHTTDVVTVQTRVPGVKKDEDGNIVPGNLDPSKGPIDYVITDTFTIDHGQIFVNPPGGAVTETKSGTAPSAPLDDSKKSVWTPTTSEEAAKDGTLRQGVDKIVDGLSQINATLKARLGSGTGGVADNSGIESRLDTANEHLEKIAQRAEAETDLRQDNPTTSDMQSEAGAGKSSVESSYGSKSLPGLSFPSGTASGLNVIGFGYTFNLDPLSDSSVATLASFTRELITFLVSVLLLWWVWGEFSTVVQTLIHSRQAQGNAVLGGTGAQATALIAAAAITGILVTIPALYWAVADVSLEPMSSGSGPLGIAFYLFRAFFPVEFLLSAAATCFVIRKGALVLVATTATLIRFIVP